MIDNDSASFDSKYNHLKELDGEKLHSFESKLVLEQQREHDLKTIAELTLKQNN
jgi:hypothetical protein